MPKFNLYHVKRSKLSQVAMGTGEEAVWPMDYEHVADVEAENPNDVLRMTNIDFQVAHGNWQNNKGVICYVQDPRSTSVGDVVLTPDGKAIRYMMGDNKEIDWSRIEK